MTTVRELIAELQDCDPDAQVVLSTREEYLGAIDGFGLTTYSAGANEPSVSAGTVIIRETFG